MTRRYGNKGAVKPGNWGYGYQIENPHAYKETKDSCYKCLNCTDNKYCRIYGLPIPVIGKNNYLNCKHYVSEDQ